MPVNSNDSTAKRQQMTNSFGKSARKTPGTRLGTLDDWRGGSTKPGKTSSPHGHTIRDGR